MGWQVDLVPHPLAPKRWICKCQDYMGLFRKLPFRWKVTLSIMLTCLVAVLVASAAFIWYEVLVYREAKAKELSGLAQLITANSKTAVLDNDTRAARQALAALKSEQYIVAACIYSKENGLVAKYIKEEANEFLPFAPSKVRYRF